LEFALLTQGLASPSEIALNGGGTSPEANRAAGLAERALTKRAYGAAVVDAAIDEVFADDIRFPAGDGYSLAATLFLPHKRRRGAVLINSATAVPRKIYKGFATYLASRGFVALTYDYRGTGDSRPETLVGFKASMTDWAVKDVAAAINWMRERYPALPLAYVGHSFGGQALGLAPNNSQVKRALLIASQAGTWKLIASPERYRVFALLNFVARPMTLIKGYAPGNMGLGEDLPRDVMLQWIRWVNSDRYFFSDKGLAELSNFPDYHGALCALCFSDDPWATRPAVELLCSGFTGTKPDIQTIDPSTSGADKIGHFGFFRDVHRDTLWKSAGDWLRTWTD
jgi:predicted alpha/beta hydrolase